MDRIMGWLIRCVICISRFSKFLSGAGLCRYDERTPDGPLRILLAGYNGARNTGADVRVISIARQLLSLYGEDELQVTVMTMDPDNMKGYFPENVRMLKFSPIYMLDLWKACSGHHAVILCEGSTLTGTFANALAMFYIEAAGIMKMQGKPSIAYGSEVGPMEPWLEKMARKYCSETYFITRTEHALERLHQLGLRGHQGTDTAWSFEADGARHAGWGRTENERMGRKKAGHRRSCDRSVLLACQTAACQVDPVSPQRKQAGSVQKMVFLQPFCRAKRAF